MTTRGPEHYDVVVVGAGIGGIYAIHRFAEQGLTVLGLEGAPDVGGVWLHNRYPGARVDVDSLYYSYYFSAQVIREWTWSERYATQPEILSYLNFVAERCDVRRRIAFNTWMTGATWQPEHDRYLVTTDTGSPVTCRFLVMATGQLSKARRPPFDGLEDFGGEWVQTAHWPDREVETAGKRIAVIGTGSSGIQTVPPLAAVAEHLHVFQRTANYCAPARNGPVDAAAAHRIREEPSTVWEELLRTAGAQIGPPPGGPAASYTETEQLERLEERWRIGGHAIRTVFGDQNTDLASNDVVSEFVRRKIRETVDDPVVAETLCPVEYPIGTRRLCVAAGYYETFNRDNVTLVDVRADPIVRITPTGIQTKSRHIELDLLVFALGFDAFTGALDAAGIRNEHGASPTDGWGRGPRTHLGLMTAGFPNLFLLTGPGSPSVLSNMVAANTQHVDFVADLMGHLTEQGHRRVEVTTQAEDAWGEHVADVARPLLRLQVDNYMVHVNDDHSRVLRPYGGGLNQYVERCAEVVKNGYEGFVFQ